MGVFSRLKSKKKRQTVAKPAAAVDSDSDISLLTDSDLEEERAALRAELNKPRQTAKELAAAALNSLDQASLWAEVDRDELERMAINIARNALPPSASVEGAEAAARLNASAAAAEQAEAHDSEDPLGYGRIDVRTLTLVREGGAPRPPPRYSAAAAGLLDAAQRAQLVARGRGGGGGVAAAAGEAPAALRAKVLPGSESFDPVAYLSTVHAGSSLEELQQGLLALRRQLSEHTGQLKSLVKENFERFISSKNTIDTVHAQLRKAEAEGEAGVHGASSGEVLEAVLQVQSEAKRAFGPLLERQAKADRVRLVLGVMKRYESIVQLPSRLRQHADAGDYEQVVSDYRRARALLADQAGGGGSGGSLWAKLMDEIDKVVSSAAHSLEAAVRSAGSGPGEALEAARHLLQLRAAGAPAALAMDPVGLFVESQERHMRAALEGAQSQHAARLDALRRQQRASADAEAAAASLESLGLGGGGAAAASPAGSAAGSAAPTPRGGGGGGEAAAAIEAATVQYVAAITAALCRWLPDFWAAVQQRLPGLAAAGDAAASVERGMAAAHRGLGVLLSLYRSAVQSVLASPAPGELTHAGLLRIAAELAGGCEALRAPVGGGDPPPAAPPAALDCLQRLTEQAVLACLAQLSGHLAAEVSRLCAAEDFALTPASRRCGAPATATVAALQRLLQEGMGLLRAALAEGERAEAQPLRGSAAPARAVFFGCFAAFAAGVDTLAAATLSAPGSQQPHSLAAEAASAAVAAAGRGGGGGRDAPRQLSPTRRLLVLCANLGAVRRRLLPQLYQRWAALLQAGGGAREVAAAAQAAGAELEAVETRLAGAYIDRKQAVLDEAMEQLLFLDGTAWEAAPPPRAPRPAALSLLHAVAGVGAELAATAPALLAEALEELLLGTLDGFAQVLRQGSPPASPGGVLQLHLEAALLLAAVGGLAAGSQLLGGAAARLQAAADARLEAAVAAAAADTHEAAALEAWLGEGCGGSVSVAACRQRLESLCEQARRDARCTLAALQQLALPPL